MKRSACASSEIAEVSGDLEAKLARCHPRRIDLLGHEVQKVGCAQRLSRYVDREHDIAPDIRSWRDSASRLLLTTQRSTAGIRP